MDSGIDAPGTVGGLGEEWNRRWSAASGTDASGPATGSFWGGDDGSGIVRESLGSYALYGAWSELPDEVDDLRALAMHGAAVVCGLLADRALRAPSAA